MKNLPTINPALFSQRGAGYSSAVIPIDTGIKIPNSKPELPASLSSGECVKMFGAKDAVLMNFIPQMLTALALEQVEAYISYCRDNRLSEYKRHNREMRGCIDEYNHGLIVSYGQAWDAYQHYLGRLRDTVQADLFKCWCTFTNEAARQYVGIAHTEIPARVTLARMLITFVEDFDRNMDKAISEKINTPCHRKQDPYRFLISVLCLDIVETFGCKMQVTDTMALCVKVLANRCHCIVDEILSEEGVLP